MNLSSKLPYLFCFLFLVFLGFDGNSQDTFKRKVVYTEVFGSGGYGSINYDIRFKPGNDGLGFRIGIGVFPSTIVIPIGINGLIGKKRFAFEYGTGLSAAFYTGLIEDNFGLTGFVKAGIRYTPVDKGLFLNLNWNPFITPVGPFLGWFGFGIGYSWKHGIN